MGAFNNERRYLSGTVRGVRIFENRNGRCIQAGLDVRVTREYHQSHQLYWLEFGGPLFEEARQLETGQNIEVYGSVKPDSSHLVVCIKGFKLQRVDRVLVERIYCKKQ